MEKLRPDLFDHLYQCVKVNNERDIRLIETSDMLPNTCFFSDALSDDARAREGYFAKMLESFRGLDLIFFDPDNGFAVPSTALGRRNSSKYLYWEEMARAYAGGPSILVYQHFIREPRESFIERIAARIGAETNPAAIYSFRTPHVVFFLALQTEHADHFCRQSEQISGIWDEEIIVSEHPS